MLKKRSELGTQLDALLGLTHEKIETHFGILILQMIAVNRIATEWRAIRQILKDASTRGADKACHPYLENIFRYVEIIDNLLVERANFMDPSAVNHNNWTDRMTAELHSFRIAMATFSRPVKWLSICTSSAFHTCGEVVEHIHNRLSLVKEEYNGKLSEINWADRPRDIDLEHLSKDFPRWYQLDIDHFGALLEIERARATAFLVKHHNRLGSLRAGIRAGERTPAELAAALKSVPTGAKGAHEFQRLVGESFRQLFPRSLRWQAEEQRLNEGRKRIDLVFTNVAADGFFARLDSRFGVRAPFIFIECKNLASDPKNQDVDQLLGRFSNSRGHFGLLVCRRIVDWPTLTARCRDIRSSDRGVVIAIDSQTLIDWLETGADARESQVEAFFERRYRELVM